MTRNEARLPFFLLWRQLRRGNLWTTMLIISLMAIAFINLVFVSSLFQGIIYGTNRQIIDMSTGHVTIIPPNGESLFASFAPSALLDELQRDPIVAGAVAETTLQARVTFARPNDGTRSGTWKLVAIDPDALARSTRIPQSVVEGRFLDEHEADGIVLGRQIVGGSDVEMDALSLGGARVGDTVTVEIGGYTSSFVIRGIVATKFIDTDSTAFLTNDALARFAPSLAGQPNSVVVRLSHDHEERAFIASYEHRFPARYLTWEDAAGIMKGVSKSFLSINIILSIVAILIAAVTIFIVVYIDVSAKKRDIGILRAIGVTPTILRWTYVLLSVFYAFAGMLLGSALFFGIVLPYFIAHPFTLPIVDATLSFTPADLISRVESVFAVSILAGLIPALHFTRIRLLDAIWGTK